MQSQAAKFLLLLVSLNLWQASCETWDFIDDGYFDPFTHDWGLGLQPYNFSRAVEHRRLHIEGRRLANSILTCDSDECVCDGSSTNDECGVDPTQCPCCIRCTNTESMKMCGETGAWGSGVLIEDKYYPKQTTTLGSCENIDDRVSKLSESIFGADRTFRDTEFCRNLAMEYICLFWGSQSLMYENRCYSSAFDDIALFPCRSLCLRLAVACANNADYKDICYRIPCCGYSDDSCDFPIQGTDCEDGPSGYISSLEECDVYEFSELTADFYSSGYRLSGSTLVLLVVAMSLLVSRAASSSHPLS